MPQSKYQLIVDLIGDDTPRGPSTTKGAWTRTRAHGVVSVERAPGVARDAATRPVPAPTSAAARATAVAERDAAIYGSLEHASAREIARMIGVTRNAVLGACYRHRVRHGLAPRPTAAALAAGDRHADLVTALAALPPAAVAERHEVGIKTVRAAARRGHPVVMPFVRAAAAPAVPVVCEGVVCEGSYAGNWVTGPIRRRGLQGRR